MTRLSGEFHTDLAPADALMACAEAIHELGWPIDSRSTDRIVSRAGPATENPPTIELDISGSEEGSDIRITGRDSEANPLDRDALIAELDRARDAIEASIQKASEEEAAEPEAEETAEPEAEETAEPEAEEAAEPEQPEAAEAQAPAGWYPDLHNPERLQYWDGERWTQRYQPADPGLRPEPAEPETAERRFSSLHLIAGIYSVLGWLVAIVGSIGVIAAAVNANSDSSGGDPAAILVVGLIAVAFYALALFGIAAAIRLALAVEENTRRTVEVLTNRERKP
jgi:hypothetical protein